LHSWQRLGFWWYLAICFSINFRAEKPFSQVGHLWIFFSLCNKVICRLRSICLGNSSLQVSHSKRIFSCTNELCSLSAKCDLNSSLHNLHSNFISCSLAMCCIRSICTGYFASQSKQMCWSSSGKSSIFSSSSKIWVWLIISILMPWSSILSGTIISVSLSGSNISIFISSSL